MANRHCDGNSGCFTIIVLLLVAWYFSSRLWTIQEKIERAIFEIEHSRPAVSAEKGAS